MNSKKGFLLFDTSNMVYSLTEKEKSKMTLEQYKKKVEQNLITVSGKKKAQEIMKEYEKDFQTIYQDNWSVEGITPALLMNLY